MLYLPSPKVRNKITRIFSFGGGVQSTTVLVLQAQNKLPIPYDWFVFANVGNDSENPATIEYMETVTKPFATRHGIRIVEVQKTTFGKPETLLEYIYRTKRSVPIPARMSNGAPSNRSCTSDFKIRVVNRWVKERGYIGAGMGLGISVDESTRRRHEAWYVEDGIHKRREHPLIDLRMNRNDCYKIIHDAGLPMPPKSACWFCPFTSRGEWVERKMQQPELFAKAVALENHLNEKRESMGRDRVFLHPATKGQMQPLDQAVPNQLSMMTLLEETCVKPCDSGYCFV